MHTSSRPGLRGATMRVNKRAQGLPINLIILAIIAALVLVVVVVFTVGGTSNVFGKISKSSAVVGGDLEAMRATCKSFCDRIQTVSSIADWDKSQYCGKKFSIDLDNNGKIENPNAAGKNELNLDCWDPAINVGCSVEVSFPDGSSKTCSPPAVGIACDGSKQCV